MTAARGHLHGFARMLCELGGHRLPAWTDAVRADELPALRAFADGLRHDQQAVTAGPILRRQMYGRAGFALLRKRVLLT
ncbi:hypothetical protein [Streptomyces sp. NBC_01518]|uniref:hypothetical protein n=1 Tax=Streptomyces sp. NBC_01518 TaxID=2903891 RepID=UPI0038675763